MLAGVFPGQGSEYVGMLGPLEACPETVPATLVEEIFGKIKDASGRDVYPVLKYGPEAALKSPLNAQLSVFGVSACYWHALRGRYQFSALAGHSLGFYTALYAAGSISLEGAVKIIKEAQDAIEEVAEGGTAAVREGGTAPTGGAMAVVIGLRADVCEAICADAGGVFVANVNSASQVVISGRGDMVKYVAEKALEAGALSVRDLSIPYPLHTPFMLGIKDRLMPLVVEMDIKEPLIPVFGHTGGGFLGSGGIIDALAGQLERKVLWRDVVTGLGAKRYIEVGPSSVLTKLVRWVDRDAEAISAEEIVCLP